MDTICREYIKQTQMLFPIIRKKERIYLKSLYNDLLEYCDINKISNLQELFYNYGSPAQIVQEYLLSLNESDLKNCLKRKYIKKFFFYMLCYYSNNTHNHIFYTTLFME